jgi:SAM-dependent methyltransferase
MNLPLLLAAIVIAAVILLLFALAIVNFTIFLDGVPYVPSKKKIVYRVLKIINPKPNSLFMDLGCGDGYVVRYAAEKFKVNGLGIDLNPILIVWANLLSLFTGLRRQARFKTQNVFRADISRANYIFVYLTPQILEKLAEKFQTEGAPGALIISNSFVIKGMEKFLVQIIPIDKVKVFVYQL